MVTFTGTWFGTFNMIAHSATVTATVTSATHVTFNVHVSISWRSNFSSCCFCSFMRSTICFTRSPGLGGIAIEFGNGERTIYNSARDSYMISNNKVGQGCGCVLTRNYGCTWCVGNDNTVGALNSDRGCVNCSYSSDLLALSAERSISILDDTFGLKKFANDVLTIDAMTATVASTTFMHTYDRRTSAVGSVGCRSWVEEQST
jgi:hypothetical protein